MKLPLLSSMKLKLEVALNHISSQLSNNEILPISKVTDRSEIRTCGFDEAKNT